MPPINAFQIHMTTRDNNISDNNANKISCVSSFNTIGDEGWKISEYADTKNVSILSVLRVLRVARVSAYPIFFLISVPTLPSVYFPELKKMVMH
jgi:hypothetical protein